MYILAPGVDVLRRHPPGVCGEWLCAWLEVTRMTGEPQGDHMSLTYVVLSFLMAEELPRYVLAEQALFPTRIA